MTDASDGAFGHLTQKLQGQRVGEHITINAVRDPLDLLGTHLNRALLTPETLQQTLIQAKGALMINLDAPPRAAICIKAKRCHEIAALVVNHRHQRCDRGAVLIMSIEKFMVNSPPEQFI